MNRARTSHSSHFATLAFALALCIISLFLSTVAPEHAEAATLQRGDVTRASSGGIVLDAELHTKQPVFDKPISTASAPSTDTSDTVHTYSYAINVPAKTYKTLGTTVRARWNDVGFDADDDRIDLVVSWLPDSRWYSLSALSQIPLLQRYDKNGYGTAGICVGIDDIITGARTCCEQHLKISFFKRGTSTPASGSFLTKFTDLDKDGWESGYGDRWCESIEFVSGHESNMYVPTGNILNIGKNRNGEAATDYRATRAMEGSSLDSGVVTRLSPGAEFWYYSTHGWTDILDQFEPQNIMLSSNSGGKVHCGGTTGELAVGWRGNRTISIEPSTGYKIIDVKVDGSSIGTTTSVPFTNVTQDRRLEATFGPIAYTIKFNANGATGTMASLAMPYNTSKRLTNNAFARKGHLFTGWNTRADGTGTSYQNAQEVRNLSSIDGAVIELYAQWKPIEYHVIFDANGGAGSMPNQHFVYDQAQTLAPNTFAKTGYSFDGWSTRQDGSGEAFTNEQEVKNLASNQNGTITLYAQWTPITYRITFDAHDGDGSMGDQRLSFDQPDRLRVNQFTRTGYLFTGWNTQADGNGTRYTDLQEIRNLSSTPDDTIALYAQWTPIGYYVVFDAQGGSGTMPDQLLFYDRADALQHNTLHRTGYRWVTWNTHPSIPETNYADGEIVKNLAERANETVVLYAIWTANRCLIVYDSNGGTGVMHAQSLAYGTAETLYPNEFEREGHRWTSWNTQPDGSGLSYDNEQRVQDLSTIDNSIITLYAQWEDTSEDDAEDDPSLEPGIEDPDAPDPDRNETEEPGERPSDDPSDNASANDHDDGSTSAETDDGGSDISDADAGEMDEPGTSEERASNQGDGLSPDRAAHEETSRKSNASPYAKTGEAIMPLVCCALAGATLGAALIVHSRRKKKRAFEKQRQLFRKYLKP